MIWGGEIEVCMPIGRLVLLYDPSPWEEPIGLHAAHTSPQTVSLVDIMLCNPWAMTNIADNLLCKVILHVAALKHSMQMWMLNIAAANVHHSAVVPHGMVVNKGGGRGQG